MAASVQDTPGPPIFAGFAGFGAGSSATSNSFTFSVQPPTTSADPTSVSQPASSYAGFKPQSNASETISATTGLSSLPALGSSAFGSNSSVPNCFTSSKPSNTSTDTPVKTAIAFGTSSPVFRGNGDTGKLSLFATPTISNAVTAGDTLDSSNELARSLGTNLFDGDK